MKSETRRGKIKLPKSMKSSKGILKASFFNVSILYETVKEAFSRT